MLVKFKGIKTIGCYLCLYSSEFTCFHIPPPPFYGHYTGQPAAAAQELEKFVGAEFYCPRVLADRNQRFRIRQNTLEFSLTVLSTLYPYHITV